MMRKILTGVALTALMLAGVGVVLYVTNAAPSVPALTGDEVARTDTPYVVKIHAQWCSTCLVTKDVWTQVVEAYTGRVRFVVFDVTNDETEQRSRVEATRLGLTQVFDDYAGATGAILVANGQTKIVLSDIYGSRDLTEYRAAIDQALQAVAK